MSRQGFRRVTAGVAAALMAVGLSSATAVAGTGDGTGSGQFTITVPGYFTAYSCEYNSTRRYYNDATGTYYACSGGFKLDGHGRDYSPACAIRAEGRWWLYGQRCGTVRGY